jgi:DNA helicase-2/ATP-dependent DNA helicase PcrA
MISAKEIAARLGPQVPTPEQEAIIEAPVDAVFRVIAGAGSGKTETMAQRVLWLIANGHVEPAGVLGLTFTKKAAGELSRRISTHLGTLRQGEHADAIDEFQRPTVSTYNAFAASLYREHAVLLGRDPDAGVLSEASAWALTRRVVARSTQRALEHWDVDASTLTGIVRKLSSRLSENQVDIAELGLLVDDFHQTQSLPPGGSGVYAEVEKWVSNVDMLPTVVALVQEVAEAKRLRGVVEFSDQIAFALELVQRFPHIAQDVRTRYTVVLLDEYQDTSVAQTTLLAQIFGGHPVMAVGDPHQAIYGWRGASSANLRDFETAFGPGVSTATLSTSWRNGTAILDAANLCATALGNIPGLHTEVLRAGPAASSHSVDSLFETTLEEEAASVARWFGAHLSRAGTPPSAAVILRQRAHQKVFVDALVAAKVPVHVLGIGGLLDDPAIADVVCALRVISMPHAETELVRLLTGGKWRLGASDIHALSDTARWLRGRDEVGVAVSPEIAARLRQSVAPMDHAGLLDALVFLASAPASHHQAQLYSPEGLVRLVQAHHSLQRMQGHRFGDVAELVVAIEEELQLDIETLAHPGRTGSVSAREAFMDALQGYLAYADDDSAAGFVEWLDQAERRDNLSPRPEEAEKGCVQVLTIHGAKGLEWDIVALPRLVEDELPSKPKDLGGWLSPGELPYPFRGDRRSLPEFSWRGIESRKDLVEEKKAFSERGRDYQSAEERRLMYVAVTRAKHHLLLSGSYWAHQVKPRQPSRFLAELVEAELIPALPANPHPDSPPPGTDIDEIPWPRDPLGSRRSVVEAAAEAVREQMAAGVSQEPHDAGLALVLEVLRETPGDQRVSIPVRIPASSLERLITDPSGFRETLARPVPQKPHSAALRGTLFHRFVEQRFDTSIAGPRLSIDDPDSGADDGLSIEQWKAAFDASKFALVAPLAVEAELHFPVGGHLIICKIDAVFPTATGVHIVDWKTGKAPATLDELAAKSLQLAAYRLAWSQWSNTPLEQIEASFWFATTGDLITPQALPDREAFAALLSQALGEP